MNKPKKEKKLTPPKKPINLPTLGLTFVSELWKKSMIETLANYYSQPFQPTVFG